MTNRFNNWERLVQVIDRWHSNINKFARQIGFERSENLYHIRKGNFGISNELADRITAFDRDIDRTWLLSGLGQMLKSDMAIGKPLPFYIEPMEETLAKLEKQRPKGYIQLPYLSNIDLVIRSFTPAMTDSSTAATDLFLHKLNGVHEVVQGNEHVLQIGDEILWRKVRYIRNQPGKWRLVALNRDEFPDMIVNIADVKQAWRVITRMTILES